jgi:hypothetical protein
VRIATRSRDYWRRSDELRERAWGFVRERVRPDVALVQEAGPGGQCSGVVFREGGACDDRSGRAKDLGWGSAVVSFGLSLRGIDHALSPFRTEPNPVPRTLPGTVATAKVESNVHLIVVSVRSSRLAGALRGHEARALAAQRPDVRRSQRRSA